ncbi:MAG: hypothetical protein JWN03_7403 [Nocardia sp.]|uniref:hypothetical protein n=1 Tax=Nocardia sp. TaxID=1821 RepID=UPI0026211516|nr:hypothetical protein [Nocardia sp.]MCU1647128.1 hypothetical protein [Nocardia sp.]
MTTQTFTHTGETTSEGHAIYLADGPVSGRFEVSYAWRKKQHNSSAAGWVLRISGPRLSANRVDYHVNVDLMVEPAIDCTKEPGSEAAWWVRKADGKWDDYATPSAREKLEALFADVYAVLHIPHALWEAKIQRAQDQIIELQDARTKFLTENDALIDSAARRLSFHMDNPA